MEFENMSFFDDQPDEQKIQSVQKSVVPRQNFRSLVWSCEPRREVVGDQKKAGDFDGEGFYDKLFKLSNGILQRSLNE